MIRLLRQGAIAAALLARCALAEDATQGTIVAGVTAPLHDAELSSPVAGTIATNFFKEGARVPAGEAILELENDLERLEVERRKLIWESRNELDAAEARVQTYKIALDSNRQLFQTTRSVSQEDLNKSELEYKMAVAERDRLRDQEAREKIEYAMALEQLRQRRIVAPFTGVLTDLYLEVGEDCDPGQPLARLVDSSECYFVANAESAVAGRLAVGDAVELAMDGGPAPVARTGTVEFVSAVVDPASGLRKVRVKFDNADGRVAAGVCGTMRLTPPASP